LLDLSLAIPNIGDESRTEKTKRAEAICPSPFNLNIYAPIALIWKNHMAIIPTAEIAIKISGDALRAFLFHVESSFAGMSLTYAAVSPKTPIAKIKKNASTMLTITFQSV
jgi:hypothetical protein